jgi:hypothetical protein
VPERGYDQSNLLQIIKKSIQVLSKNLKGRDHLENLGTCGTDIETQLKKLCGSVEWMNFT